MLSVIIATLDSERMLASTLASLVAGAVNGLISEVVVADGGSSDGTATVADAAGCNFLLAEGSLGRRLKTAAAATRAPWLFFLRPGIVLDAAWIAETNGFLQSSSRTGNAAAVFRRNAAARTALGDVFSALAAALGARPHPDQGLVIAKQFYAALGGHDERAADPEADLIRRIGRRRIVLLSSRALPAG